MAEEIQMKAEELRREYLREWRKKHPDAVRKHNKDYWVRKAQREKEKKDATDQDEVEE